MTVVESLLGRCGLPRSEALLLLAHASGSSRERLIAGSKETLSPTIVDAFDALATRRVSGEPIAYLIGSREFYGRGFAVDPTVLIPRPETELLVDRALHRLDGIDHRPRVLDLGTGSGVIAVTLALERRAIEMVATDRSDPALRTARRNAAALEAPVRFESGDWFDAVAEESAFDLIVSNPPYIARDDRHLRDGDLRFEPPCALTDDGDGLTAIRVIVAGSRRRLRGGGALMVEHGHDQAEAVRGLFAAAGFVEVASIADLAGIERVTEGLIICG